MLTWVTNNRERSPMAVKSKFLMKVRTHQSEMVSNRKTGWKNIVRNYDRRETIRNSDQTGKEGNHTKTNTSDFKERLANNHLKGTRQ